MSMSLQNIYIRNAKRSAMHEQHLPPAGHPAKLSVFWVSLRAREATNCNMPIVCTDMRIAWQYSFVVAICIFAKGDVFFFFWHSSTHTHTFLRLMRNRQGFRVRCTFFCHFVTCFAVDLCCRKCTLECVSCSNFVLLANDCRNVFGQQNIIRL